NLGSATLTTGNASDASFTGVIAGTGNLVKQGSGSWTLGGAHTYSGSTTVAAGTLALAGSELLNDATVVNVATGATLDLSGSETITTLNLAGRYTGAGLLTAANTVLDSGTVLGQLGAGNLRSLGNSSLSGSSAAGSVQVDTGVLTLTAADRLADSANVQVASGATLNLASTDTVANLVLRGTLNGSGQLRTTSTTLDGGQMLAQLRSTSVDSQGNSLLGGSLDTTSLRVLDGSLTLAQGGLLLNLPTTTVASGAVMNLGGNEAVGLLDGAGTVNLGNATLSAGTAGNSVFSGVLNGTGGFTKQGTGTLVLTGDSLYSGATRVDGGTLQLGDGTASATSGSLAQTSGYIVNGSLQFARANTLTIGVNIQGSGTVVQAGLGTTTFQGGQRNHTGATVVQAGELATVGAEQLSDVSTVQVAQGARLTLGGNETVGGVDAQGAVALAGNLTASVGDLRLQGAVTASNGTALTLRGRDIQAQSDGNRWGSALSLDASGTLNVASGRGSDGQRLALTLDAVTAANGGQIDAGLLNLNGRVAVNGGTLALLSSAAATPTAPDAALIGKQTPGQRQVSWAADAVQQGAASQITVENGALLRVVSTEGASVQLLNANNRFSGGLEVLSGGSFTAWSPRAVNTTLGGVTGDFSLQGRVQVAATELRVGGAGIEADVVALTADRLATNAGAVITARLPFDNLSGLVTAVPGLTLTLNPAAFALNFPFGQGPSSDAIAINVGSKAWGNRTSLPIDGGYVAVLPRGGRQGSTAVFLAGPPVAGSYAFFYDGAGVESEIPVYYNGVTTVSPQVSSSLAATVAVSEGARKERFDEAVRTENVALRLRAGVIAEVGPGRPATVGSESPRPPASCPPADNSLACQ
ncbi:MAG: beta strand repeat-containing protein, partial [Rubrivivax sp.]